MEITRNVVNDLLPVYLAGEASDDTRALLEEYLRQNPEFAKELKENIERSSTMLNATTLNPPPDRERESLSRTKAELQKRSYMLALALAFTLVPLSFTFEGGHISWSMLGSAPPMMTGLFWFLAAIWWVVYFVTRHKLRNSGL